jgi:membrane-associated phospholipid phosphatase
MGFLHFSLPFVDFLANHRNIALTRFFLGASAIGNAEFYVLLIMLIYVMWDKKLAVRLSFLVLLTMAFNDVLKNLIRNPRPFLREGTYPRKWAVSPAEARALAAEFSTPSGHAMGASSFYSYLCIFVRNRWVRIACVVAIFSIGASRPYLGVHYGEDILLGWAIGLAMALLAAKYTSAISTHWHRRSYAQQVAIAVAAAFALCVVGIAVNGWQINGQLHGMAAFAGFLTGNVVACPLEIRLVNFDPRSAGPAAKVSRLVLTAGIIGVVQFVLKLAFARIAPGFSASWLALEYLRYLVTSVAGMYGAPWLFCRMKLAARLPAPAQ